MISLVEPGRTPSPHRQRATLVNTRSRESRLALIRAALRLWGQGDFNEAYEASTVTDIAQAAGVSRGTFYFHFANKEAILLEMSSATIQAMIDQVEESTGKGVPLRPLSEQVMASMARRVVRAPKGAALRAGSLGFTGRADDGTLANPRLSVAFDALIRYGKERGELSARIDVEEVAAMLTAVTMEAIIRWGAGDRSASWLSQTLQERVAIILRGISHPDDG
ncbi:TetR/AcrR family transcriptional regulator [Frankia sp. CNm7]|uniref:TetR/AcrR family transcriptional regulator n=1 Tax=Frankia nepalensis TaxID=1836974 RepID=A0A937RQA8_9ACTN|nr:TetR/AcrR family transcriptional regulator [Frankia nepalensis]MBL7502653.1 TetR/AcrR family transcriptional regulator [Frankia nepalensis]MBL7514879.1 TetR/AcrR family transcriptional regulator [Frankia nepalensis]MBL7524622.1 TetR/AcrR family transcriptional regulator [Frankia nepalensis]MBL7633025.1 TetR/AcrR family transcriptional regulator [Frankia nepalensis]